MIGRVYEIFSSIQGEGIYAGTPMVFVRFTGCNLQCDYCDTPKCRSPLAGKVLTVEEITDRVEKELENSKNISIISFTGGEPLLQAEIISEVISHFKGRPRIYSGVSPDKKIGVNSANSVKIYIDTNGTLYEKFSKIADTVDYIAMDIKLPSSCGVEYWQEHAEFLKLAKNNIFIKIVLTAKSTFDEFKSAVKIIEKTDSSIPVVLQPVTPVGNVKPMPFESIRSLKNLAEQKLENVSIIPQIHKKLGIR